jgi:hypothetical protein
VHRRAIGDRTWMKLRKCLAEPQFPNNLEARSRMTDFVVLDGLEGHRCGLPISFLRSAARMASPAMIVCNQGESGLPDAAMGHRRRPMGLRPT